MKTICSSTPYALAYSNARTHTESECKQTKCKSVQSASKSTPKIKSIPLSPSILNGFSKFQLYMKVDTVNYIQWKNREFCLKNKDFVMNLICGMLFFTAPELLDRFRDFGAVGSLTRSPKWEELKGRNLAWMYSNECSKDRSQKIWGLLYKKWVKKWCKINFR